MFEAETDPLEAEPLSLSGARVTLKQDAALLFLLTLEKSPQKSTSAFSSRSTHTERRGEGDKGEC